MKMKSVIDAVKQAKSLTNYGVARELRERGVVITTQGIDSYAKGTSRVRLDVLCGLNEILGKGWGYLGKLLEGERKK
jgi:hypothetical protein